MLPPVFDLNLMSKEVAVIQITHSIPLAFLTVDRRKREVQYKALVTALDIIFRISLT